MLFYFPQGGCVLAGVFVCKQYDCGGARTSGGPVSQWMEMSKEHYNHCYKFNLHQIILLNKHNQWNFKNVELLLLLVFVGILKLLKF